MQELGNYSVPAHASNAGYLATRPFSIMLAFFFGIFWENEHFFSFFLEKELLAFSVIFHDCDPDFSTQNSEG